MELVQGEPILDHVRCNGLGLKDRLGLFVDVCDAIDYAHSQGVVHADIKPSNIIIDPRHGVKLLDFGIAGLIGAEGPASGFRAATPMFASPQQTAHAPASTADDIYSLGVLLQVLAGDQPGFDSELAAIVAKARAPEPEGRYASAKDIADDIGRWRRLEPVSALPARRPRTLRFFWRRNRLAVSLSATATAGLVVAVAVMTALYLQADAARRQSDQRFEEVRALSRYMLSDLTGALEQFPGTAHLRSDLAHRGRAYLEGLSRVPGAPADVRLEVARGYAKTGEILARLGSQHVGDPRAGKADLAKAETGLRRLMVETNGRDDVALALAGALVARGAVALNADNQPKLAAALLTEGCALSKSAIDRRPQSSEAHLTHLNCLLGQANVLDFQGRYAGLRGVADAFIAETRALPPGVDPTLVALDQAKILNLQGDADYYGGRKPYALNEYLKAADALRQAEIHRSDVRVLDQLAYTTYNIAASLDDVGRKREELAWIDRGVAAADQMAAFEDSPHAWRTVNIVHLQRASALASLGRFDEAIAEARANIAARHVIAEKSPHDNLAVRALPVGLRPLGDIYWAAGRHKEACQSYAEAHVLWIQLEQRHGVLGSDLGGEITLLDKLLKRCER
jgi:serine/threonine protein kinase